MLGQPLWGCLEKKELERSDSKAGGSGSSVYQAVRLFPFELGICLRSLVSFKITLFLGSLPCSLVYLPSRKQVDRPCGGLGCWEAGAGRMEWGQSHVGSKYQEEGEGPSLMAPLRTSCWQRVRAAVIGLLESVPC